MVFLKASNAQENLDFPISLQTSTLSCGAKPVINSINLLDVFQLLCYLGK